MGKSWKIHYKWPFSIAMLVHQRVCVFVSFVMGVWGFRTWKYLRCLKAPALMHLGRESMSSQVPRGSPEHARWKRRKRRCFPASVANKGERDEKVTWTERALIWNIHGGWDNQIQCACSVESCKIYVNVVFRMFTCVSDPYIYIY